MRARAPGKLLLSGAYSVLEGAPAIVSAVDRYVVCDSARPAEMLVPEVEAALGPVVPPHFDAGALRSGGRKLGLGSSAAILVASLSAVHEACDEVSLRHAIEGQAVAAHRRAQGGGSGVDVLASVWGGTSIVRRLDPHSHERTPVTLPPEIVVEVWAAPTAASTRELLLRVAELRARDGGTYAAIMGDLRRAAERAAAALLGGRSDDFVRALVEQCQALHELGSVARANIVTDAVLELAASAEETSAAVLPSGAGGGDIVLWVSRRPSPPDFGRLATHLGHELLNVGLGARGAHQMDAEGNFERGS